MGFLQTGINRNKADHNGRLGVLKSENLPLEPGNAKLPFFDRVERTFQPAHPTVQAGALFFELSPFAL
jgi:hypothetical protein